MLLLNDASPLTMPLLVLLMQLLALLALLSVRRSSPTEAQSQALLPVPLDSGTDSVPELPAAGVLLPQICIPANWSMAWCSCRCSAATDVSVTPMLVNPAGAPAPPAPDDRASLLATPAPYPNAAAAAAASVPVGDAPDQLGLLPLQPLTLCALPAAACVMRLPAASNPATSANRLGGSAASAVGVLVKAQGDTTS
jgi:hypothetical protein